MTKAIVRCCGALVPLCLCLLSVGCSSSSLPGPSGTVSGLATYKKSPIPQGSAVVMVHDETGLVGIGITDSNGKFSVKMNGDSQVLCGNYIVYIKPPGELGENVVVYRKDTVPPEWNKIPMAYWSASTSKQRFEVLEGANDFQFVLND